MYRVCTSFAGLGIPWFSLQRVGHPTSGFSSTPHLGLDFTTKHFAIAQVSGCPGAQHKTCLFERFVVMVAESDGQSLISFPVEDSSLGFSVLHLEFPNPYRKTSTKLKTCKIIGHDIVLIKHCPAHAKRTKHFHNPTLGQHAQPGPFLGHHAKWCGERVKLVHHCQNI